MNRAPVVGESSTCAQRRPSTRLSVSAETTLSRRPRSARAGKEERNKKKEKKREKEKECKKSRRGEKTERTCILSGYSGNYRRWFRQRIPLLSSYLRYVADKLYGILGALSYGSPLLFAGVVCPVRVNPGRGNNPAPFTPIPRVIARSRRLLAKKILYARVDRSRSHWRRARNVRRLCCYAATANHFRPAAEEKKEKKRENIQAG
ncbi:hypothetical protein PUN28_015640 [Cardiocondyla obscurior]|uniref:Uncharacterized protein n=1 Tax=Cardiocondyla obscurior TaxID=286306 RepID=A0AAW2EYF5_9HYME